MPNTPTIPRREKRTFVAEDFNPNSWACIEPYFNRLKEQPIESVEDLKQWLKNWSELDATLSENSRWIYVRTTVDTTDEKAKADLENQYKNIYPYATAAVAVLEARFVNCPFTAQLDEALFFTTIRRVKKQVQMFRPENIPLLSELNLKQSRFDEITGRQSIVYKGSELTLQQASVYYKSNQRTEREEVFKLVGDRRLQDAEELDALLTELIQLRHRVALNAGYKNFLDYRFDELGRFDYTAADCEAFHQTIKETVVPALAKQAEQRKKALGLDALRIWDTDVDTTGKPALKPVNSTEELVDKTITCFNRLDPYFGERIEIMRQMNYLDLESRLHKGPGGYNMTMPEIGVPFIFMNSANGEHDLVTMVHEGGHAVHTFLAHPLELTMFKEVTSEIAEVASMGMELMSMEHWDVFYPQPDDLARARKNHLEYILTLLSKTCIGDSFQFWLYQNPDHTVEERRAKWRELFTEYNPGIDWTGCETYLETGYHKILHFFVVPLYYIEYAFAQLGALALWRSYKSNPQQTVNNYKKALSMGYTQPIPVFYETVGGSFNFSKQQVGGLIAFLEGEIGRL